MKNGKEVLHLEEVGEFLTSAEKIEDFPTETGWCSRAMRRRAVWRLERRKTFPGGWRPGGQIS